MVGRWTGLQNFVGNFAGAVAPTLTGYLLDKTGLFDWPFFITSGVAWVGTFAWTVVIGPIEEVKWKHLGHGPITIPPSATPESV
jgi:MFS family permease